MYDFVVLHVTTRSFTRPRFNPPSPVALFKRGKSHSFLGLYLLLFTKINLELVVLKAVYSSNPFTLVHISKVFGV